MKKMLFRLFHFTGMELQPLRPDTFLSGQDDYAHSGNHRGKPV